MKFFKKLALAAAVLIGSALPAAAQSSCPYIVYGAVLTAAQWNSCFQSKADVSSLSAFSPGGANGSVQFNNNNTFGGTGGVASNGTGLLFQNGAMTLLGSSSGQSLLNAPATGGGTLTLPPGTDTVTGDAATQTLTNKSMSGSANTFTNLPLSAFTNVGTTTTVLHGNASGSPTFGAVNLGTDVSSTLSVGNGGTGLASGTSGGVPYFNATSTMASSAALAANQIIVGGGAGAAPATTTTGSGILTALASAPSGSGAIALVGDPAMTITTTGGSTARTVQNHFADALNVLDYGANAVQSGLTYLQGNGGGFLGVRGGAYSTSSGFTYTGAVDLLLQGQGSQTSAITVSGASTIGLAVGTLGTDQTQDSALRDIGFTGASGTGDNLDVNSMHDFMLQRVKAARSGSGDGVQLLRSYASVAFDVYSNNNGANGLELSAPVGGIGNDDVHVLYGHLLANTGDGFKSGGQWVGGTMIGTDMEGNAIGMEVDGGPLSPSYSDTLLGGYFENQTSHNIEIGHDGGAVVVPAFTMIGTIFNPGTVSAAANEVLFDRVRSGFVVDNHFSTVNFATTGSTSRLLVGPNEYSTAVGPWQPSASPSGYKEPIEYQISGVGTDFTYGFAPNGWSTRAVLGQTYAGNWLSLSENFSMTANTGTGTPFDTGNGASDVDLGPNRLNLWIGAAAATSLTNVLAADSTGTSIPQLKAGGSVPTLTGTCTTGTQVGGNTAGSFVASCTAQTVIITFAYTAPNGWSCNVQDETTPTDTLKQTSHSASSCTLTGTTAASDHMVFDAHAF